MTDREYAGIDLDALAEIVAEAEAPHVPIRLPEGLGLKGCSCGLTYTSDDPYVESHAHLRAVAVEAVVRALTGVCDTCSGSGMWEKFRGRFTCPDCDGLGETMLPLPLMQFRDLKGVVWKVTDLLTKTGRAYVRRRIDSDEP